MKMRHVLIYGSFAVLLALDVYSQDGLEVKNAADSVSAALAYLRNNQPQNAPDSNIKFVEKIVYSEGPIDLVTTGELFTSDAWTIEVTQGLVPLRNTLYTVTVFSPKSGWYWKGNVKPDGSVVEVNTFRQMSEEEKQKTAEEFLKNSQNPPPRVGYGH
jgi:hypothetical protein